MLVRIIRYLSKVKVLYYSNGVMCRCNVLVRIIRHLSKVISPLLR